MAVDDPITRLTEREKESLRLWLAHKTAKEIAIDLSISHHAVEKRLKMARVKLNVASSLEAARLLDAAEGYQQTAAQPADLAAQRFTAQDGGSHAKTIGVAIMILIAAATLSLTTLALTTQAFTTQALSMQATSSAEPYGALPDSGAGENVGYKGVLPEDMIRPTEAEIAVITRATFDYLDEDQSGFLAGRESPVSAPSEPQPLDAGKSGLMTQKQATDGFYKLADIDGDGRVSYTEYHQWARPTLLRIGIPEEWKKNLRADTAPEG